MSECVEILNRPVAVGEATVELLFFRGDAAVLRVIEEAPRFVTVRVGDRVLGQWFVAAINFDAIPTQPSHLLRPKPERGVTLQATFEAESHS